VVVGRQDERTNNLKCDEGDAYDAHGSVEHDFGRQVVMNFGKMLSVLYMYVWFDVCMYVM
jgi:hypothetical protein